jgi:8-oxo-dGTP pyrophosphatase MutT (NUDIX family)
MTEQPKKPSPPIRDAATLILYRFAAGQLEVLMGERAGSNAFMPNTYVFPGGRLDANDYRIRPAAPLNLATATRMGRARITGPRKALALALAAIRETYEETGLRLAGSAPPKAAEPPKGWRGFCAGPDGLRLAPDPSSLLYVCRALTPPQRPRRFDARFFAAPASATSGEMMPSDELGKLHWVTPGDAAKLELPDITKVVLSRLPEWVTPEAVSDPAKGVPYFRRKGAGHAMVLE